MNHYICIHGHFYQPPRENPWLEEIETQDLARPYHDWNVLVTEECYAPNTAARILDHEGKIIDIVNNYSNISFNIGPTLLSWLKDKNIEIYQSIIDADKKSLQQFSGHGSAIAQCYNHMIMPLANTRDKRTQIIWGIKDFEYHFKRAPEGMWLPETAVDIETLDIMAELGIKFTILEPKQAKGVQLIGSHEFRPVKDRNIDVRLPYLCKLPSGRTITIFFYNASISHEISFGDVLKDGGKFANKLLHAFPYNNNKNQLVSIATDGEVYGHHRKYGEMALSFCLHHIKSNNLAKITVYGEYLAKNLPTYEVEIVENSSWSCAHGVERWRENCSCSTGSNPEWNQKWRIKLREAIDAIRDILIHIYEKEISNFVKDPWELRNDYIEIILDRNTGKNEDLYIEKFFLKHSLYELKEKERIKVLKLLEMQRHSMLSYTSCGWFFDDISGIESIQVMAYMGRAIQLANEFNSDTNLESQFLSILIDAKSNILEHKNGAHIYKKYVKPMIVDITDIGLHYAIASLFDGYSGVTRMNRHKIKNEAFTKHVVENEKIAIGIFNIRSEITREEKIFCFTVLHYGIRNIVCGIHEYKGETEFYANQQKILDVFKSGDIKTTISIIKNHYGDCPYSLEHLFKDEKRKVINQILKPKLNKLDQLFHSLYKDYAPIINIINEMNAPLPQTLQSLMELTLNMDLRNILQKKEVDLKQLQKLVDEFERLPFEPDRPSLNYIASHKINELIKELSKHPQSLPLLKKIERVFSMLKPLNLRLDFWEYQNIYFKMSHECYQKMKKKAEKNDKDAISWIESFDSLGNHLHMKNL